MGRLFSLYSKPLFSVNPEFIASHIACLLFNIIVSIAVTSVFYQSTF